MPELPEVETIRKQLDVVLKGKKVTGVDVLRIKSFSGKSDELVGAVVDRIERKSKVIEIFFKGLEVMVICHLKMTGQLIYLDKERRIVGGHPTSDWVKELPSKHTRVVWNFSDGSRLYFNDMRVFGWMKIVDIDKYFAETRKQCPDVTEKRFDFDYLKNVCRRSNKAIKLVILDQDKIGGVGNIYANDALFLARIHPARSASSISDDELNNLVKSIKKVINLGIKYGGASAADDKYVNISGLGGKYQDHFMVYQREGGACSNCGEKIKKMRLGGRGTFYCSSCQK